MANSVPTNVVNGMHRVFLLSAIAEAVGKISESM